MNTIRPQNAARPSFAALQDWFQQATIQVRIIFLLCAMLLAATIAGTIWYRGNRQHAFLLRQDYQKEKQEFVRQVVDLKATRLHSYVVENTYWDEAVAFFRKENQQWAKTSLDTPAQSVEASALWLFRRDGSVAHSWQASNLTSESPTGADFMPALQQLSRVRVQRWFMRVGSVLWEMHGATIHPSNDPKHQGQYYGYMIAGRPCDQNYLKDVGQVAHCRLSVAVGRYMSQAGTDARSNYNPMSVSWVTVFVPLLDLYGKPLGFLQGTAENPLAPAIEQATRQAILIFGVFACSIFALNLIVLIRWLNAPMRLLSEALQNRDSRKLAALQSERTEFGSLARFIAAFFCQERALRESHEELERRVEDRTAELAYRANHDALTGLPNRALFGERLEAALVQTQVSGTNLAVLFVDLDNFKVVNDSLGHEIGDGLLRASAQRMQEIILPPDTIARLGGDEFAILLEETSELRARSVAEQVARIFQDSFFIAGRALSTTVSIGVALGRRDETPGDLLRNADIAMYRAKAQGRTGGRSSSTVFDNEMRKQADERLEIEDELRRVLQRPGDELRLVFQPIYDMQTSRLAGMEALIRWEHPVRGLISPDRFVPLAEETGLIHALTQWVLREACRTQIQLLRKLSVSARPAFISVNISAVCLQSDGIVAHVRECLKETGLDPTQLALEITESVMARHSPTVQRVLTELREMGVCIMMDDFGTGYSSLAMLADLPIDVIKIDQAFVGHLAERPESRAILRAMVELARALDMDLICEGIEQFEQRDLVLDMGCIYGQGFLFSHPLPLDAIEQLLLTSGVHPTSASDEEPMADLSTLSNKAFPTLSAKRLHLEIA